MSVKKPVVLSVNSDAAHRFSKPSRGVIRLIQDYGVEGDAHAGAVVQHRYLAKRNHTMPNLRQVHLIQSELFDDLATEGVFVSPGDLGENITTRNIDMLTLPLGTRLKIGKTAVLTLTGLRTPCGCIDKFQKGLKSRMILRTGRVPSFRAGVMSVVAKTGEVVPGDAISVVLPPEPWRILPALP
jgi:MOSC domain-containing protein YiiM